MSNTTNVKTMERLYDEIASSCLHIALVKKEEKNNLIKRLFDNLVFPEVFCGYCYDNTKRFAGTILYVGYNEDNTDKSDWEKQAKNRTEAIYQLFNRWTEAGLNASHAKNPFKSKAFIKYLDSIDYNASDYVILATEW